MWKTTGRDGEARTVVRYRATLKSGRMEMLAPDMADAAREAVGAVGADGEPAGDGERWTGRSHRVIRCAAFGAIAALAFVSLPVETAGAETVLASGLPQAPKVSAAGQAVAWSSFDPSVSAWRLMVFSDGITQALPIAPNATPFDVDLGDNGHGGLVATYSRCSQPSSAAALPRGCRLFVYEFATGTEHTITAADLPGYSEFLPSMAAGRLAFVRIKEDTPVSSTNPPRIYVQSLAGGKPELLAGGTENGDPRTGPTALDLSATALAFSWEAVGATLELNGYVDGYGTAELLVDGLSGGQTVVDLQEQGDIERFEDLSPTLFGRAVLYGLAAQGDEPGYQFRSFGLPSARRGVAEAPTGLVSTATGAAGTIYSRCSGPLSAVPSSSAPCEVVLAPSVAYVDPDRQVAQSSRPTSISAYRGNWLAFSAYQPASRTYRLMVRAPNGRVSAAPVPPREVPFDVELGPRVGDGEEAWRKGVLAVYSRCRVEPRLDPRDLLPLPGTGRGCRLYSYELGSAHEHPIPGSGSRYLPSVWGDQLAFAMTGPEGRPALYLGSISGHSAPREIAGGPLGSASGLGPRAVALYNGRVAFVWEYRSGTVLHSQLRLDEPDGNAQLLAEASSPDGTDRELSPSFTAAGLLAWARRGAGGHSWMLELERSGRVGTYLMPDPIQAISSPQLGSELPLHGTTYYARGDDHGGATIRLMAGPPAFATRG